MREQSSRALSVGARDELLRLGDDLPRLWHHPASSVEIKKRILRTVVKEVAVTKQDDTIRALVHWQRGDHTEIVFEKDRTGQHRWVTDAATIDIVRSLARTMQGEGIASLINRLGKRTARGHTWTAARICTSHKDNQITAYREGERQERGELTVAEVACLLAINSPTVTRLIRVGRLPASQACQGAPWVIQKVDVDRRWPAR